MNVKQRIRELRIQVFCMLRVSQRALDYSIKGYRLSLSDFSKQARTDKHDLDLQHRKIKSLCRRLLGEENLDASDFRFTLVALRLSKSLNTIYKLATQIAQDTILYLENNGPAQCKTLNCIGDRVNALVRLCVVSLFNEDSSLARTVLRSEGVWDRFELVVDSIREPFSGNREARNIFEMAVLRNLGLIARQAHEMADAILFWLQESADAPAVNTSDSSAFHVLLGLAEPA